MAGRSVLRAGTAAVLVVGLMAGLAGPAQAGKSWSMSKATGGTATAWWTQIDGTPLGTRFGNVHVGFLFVYETSSGRGDVFGWIDDWDCEEGEEPGGGIIVEHDGPGDEEGCDYVGSRFLEGYGLAFTLARKLTTATLKGTLTAWGGGHGSEGVVGRPAADMTWTGIGGLTRELSTYWYQSGGETYSGRYRAVGREASVSGILGPMGFDPDLSGGGLSRFSDRSRTSTR